MGITNRVSGCVVIWVPWKYPDIGNDYEPYLTGSIVVTNQQHTARHSLTYGIGKGVGADTTIGQGPPTP